MFNAAMLFNVSLLVLVFTWTGQAANFVVPSCDKDVFDRNVVNCLSDFNDNLETSGYQDSCPWPGVKSIYNNLKHCVDNWAKETWCRGHGFLVDQVFLKVHDQYFSRCGQVHDPSLTTVIMLIAPVVIATLFLPILCVHLTTYDIEKLNILGF